MREILFRGKQAYNDEWAESEYPFGTIHCGAVVHDFIPETVGQYTGLTDKNGKKIFEGDIIIDNPNYPKPTNYGVYMDKERRGYFPFACGDGCGCCERNVVDPYNCEVIGNIHDNPELPRWVE